MENICKKCLEILWNKNIKNSTNIQQFSSYSRNCFHFLPWGISHVSESNTPNAFNIYLTKNPLLFFPQKNNQTHKNKTSPKLKKKLDSICVLLPILHLFGKAHKTPLKKRRNCSPNYFFSFASCPKVFRLISIFYAGVKPPLLRETAPVNID